MNARTRVHRNDYDVLAPPALGEWIPSLTVSVIIPAFGDQEKLDLTLAALRHQTYPRHLIEVIVVDDGSAPALRLPDVVPENTRLITTEPGARGRSCARNAGVAVAGGDVVHWLDADVVCAHDQIEAQLRWHHRADYLVVKGYVRYVDHVPGALSPLEVDASVQMGHVAKLFDTVESTPHQWIVDLVDTTRGLRDEPDGAYRVHVTNSATVSRALVDAAGPMDRDLLLGEDTEFGYRLALQGAAFIPEPLAQSYHLGRSMMQRDGDRVRRFNQAHIPDRIPLQRWQRTHPRRTWMVPLLEVVVDASLATYEDTRATVDGFLASELHDLAAVLLIPEEPPSLDRRDPLTGAGTEAALLRALYRHESRVRFGGRTRAPYRLLCPAGWVPADDTLGGLLNLADETGQGLISVLLDEGDDVVTARFERRAAFARARWVRHVGEELDDVVEALWGTCWADGAAHGFRPAAQAPRPRTGTGGTELAALRAEVAALRGENQALRAKNSAPRSAG